jgi:replication factor A2
MVSHVMCQLLVDPNELTLHFMECIHVHRDRTMRISFAEGGSSPEGMAVTSDPASGTAMAGAGTGFGMAGMGGMPGMAGMSGMPAMGGAGGGMSSSLAVSGPGGVSGEPLVEQVNSRICTYSGDNGAPVSELVQFFAAKGVSEAEVRQVVEELSMAGRVYSTVDDEHVKSTEEGE